MNRSDSETPGFQGGDPARSSQLGDWGDVVNKTTFGWWLALALAMTFIVVVALGVLTYHNTTVLRSTDRLVADSYRAREVAESLLSSLKGVETSHGDFLISGDEPYLKQFRESSDQVKAKLVELRGITPESADLDKQLDTLEQLASERLSELQETLTLRQQFPGDEGFQKAKEKVLGNRKKTEITEIPDAFKAIKDRQREILLSREAEADRRATVSHRSIIIGHVLALGMLLLAVLAVRTDRRRRSEAESQLATSEARLSAIIESAMDGIITIDDQQRIVLLNPAAEEIFGCQRQSVIGQSIERFVPPRLQATLQEQLRHLSRSSVSSLRIGDGGPTVGLRADGQEFPLEASVSKTSINGQQLLTAMVRDVSERELARRRIREQTAILDQVNDAIQVRDMDDRIMYWNRGSEELYGWTAAEAVGRRAKDLMSPPQRPEPEEARQVTREKGNWDDELPQLTKSGREVLVEQRRTLIQDERGQPVGQLIINIDVTERKRAELHARRSQRLESIGTLAGGISHDLNNVLTPVLMGAKLLTREQSPTGLQRIALTIQSAAERGAEMIKQLLSFAGGAERRHEAVQLAKVIGEVENILEHSLPKSIEVRVRTASDLWPVMGDSTELCQLLLNLCINARDAMPDGGRLTITAENAPIDEALARAIPDLAVGPHAMLTVADSGAGIPRQIIDRVFDPFFTTKEQGQGTGLGLATCLGIVRSHGGAINVYSEPSHGTEFTIYLPATYSEQAVIPPTPLHDVPRGQGELILLVDDETMVLDMARATLELSGYRVLSAVGGAEAVSLYSENADDIQAVIMDMMMPGMDGTATIRALRDVHPDVRVIASSGFRGLGRDRRAEDGEIFLQKPYTDAQLLSSLRQLLDGVGAPAAVPAGAESSPTL
jgi:PAS domain S-box-containing protein